MKYYIIRQPVNFHLENNKEQLQLSLKQITQLKSKDIDKNIAEFKRMVLLLKETTGLDGYDFINLFMGKITRAYKQFLKLAFRILAKDYFRIAKYQVTQLVKNKAKTVSKSQEVSKANKDNYSKKSIKVDKLQQSLGYNKRKFISQFQSFQEYENSWQLLIQKRNTLSEMQSSGCLNYKKITAEDMKDLKDNYPQNFDYLILTKNLDSTLVLLYYNFNLYEAEHFACIYELMAKRLWLDNCLQLTLGCYIHNEELFSEFIEFCFPRKVKDLKIVYYKRMGQCTKIWYDPLFINNAG